MERPAPDKFKKHIITIAGRPGSGKSTAAKELAKRLDYKHFSSGDLFRDLARQNGVNDLTRAMRSPIINDKLDDVVDGKLREIGQEQDRLVIDSRTAWHWMPSSFKVFLDLDLKQAAQRIINETSEHRLSSESLSNDVKEYTRLLKDRLDAEADRYQVKYNIDPYDVSNYDLVIDTSVNNVEATVSQILKNYQDWLNRWHS